MNAEATLQWTIDDVPSVDDSPYSSRLRAVWLIGLPEPPDREDEDLPAEDHDLVEVTPAFAWVS
jgi:hypothetical protein